MRSFQIAERMIISQSYNWLKKLKSVRIGGMQLSCCTVIYVIYGIKM